MTQCHPPVLRLSFLGVLLLLLTTPTMLTAQQDAGAQDDNSSNNDDDDKSELWFILGAAMISAGLALAVCSLVLCYTWKRCILPHNHPSHSNPLCTPPRHISFHNNWEPSESIAADTLSVPPHKQQHQEQNDKKFSKTLPPPLQKRRKKKTTTPLSPCAEQPSCCYSTGGDMSMESEGDLNNWTFSTTSSSSNEPQQKPCGEDESVQISVSMESIDEFEASICSASQHSEKSIHGTLVEI